MWEELLLLALVTLTQLKNTYIIMSEIFTQIQTQNIIIVCISFRYVCHFVKEKNYHFWSTFC
jgi:hypothetical protein